MNPSRTFPLSGVSESGGARVDVHAVAREVAALLQRDRKRLYSVAEAADYLGRTESGIRHLIHAGIVSACKIDGRVYLDRDDMDALIESAKVVA